MNEARKSTFLGTLGALCLTLGCTITETVEPDAAPATADAPEPRASSAAELAVDTELGPPLLPLGVTSFGAASLDGDYYALGGYFGTPHEYDRSGQSGAFWRLRGGGREWESLGDIEPLQSVALAAVEGRLIRVGGMRIRNAPGDRADMHSLTEVAVYDPSAGSWSAGPPLPEPRSSHELATIGSVVYALGGWQLGGDATSGEFHRHGLALDLSVDEPTWQAFDMPFRRRALGVAAAGGKLYAIGGMDDQRSISTEVDIFDPATGAWSKGPEFPGRGFGLAATSVGGAVVASGDDGVVYRLEPGDAAWTRAGSLAFPRFFHQLVASEGEALALGGIHGMSREARTRQVERVALGDPGPALRGVWRLDSPARAKNRMAIVLAGDALYMFGGNRSVGQHDFEPEDFLAEGHRLHLPSMRWSELAPFPERRQTMGALVVGDSAVVVGGFGHGSEAARTHGEVFHYDLGEDTWVLGPGALSGTRSQFGLAAHGESLWLFGGLDYDPARAGEAAFDHRLEVLRAADPSASFEPSGVELRSPRRAFAGAALGGRYYLVGGMQEGFEPVTTCEVFEFETEAWSSITCPDTPTLSAELVAIGDALYLVGGSKMGEEGLEPNLEVLRYEPESDSWSRVLEPIPLPPKHLRAFAYNGRLLLFSAHFEQAAQAMVALIDVGEPVKDRRSAPADPR